MFENVFENRGEITHIGNDHSFLRLVTSNCFKFFAENKEQLWFYIT